MTIDNTKIKQIVDLCESKGAKVRVRDVAYVLLSQTLEPMTAYQSLFLTQEGFEDYVKGAEIAILASVMKEKGLTRATPDVAADYKSITFEENKRAMEQLIRDTQKAMDEGMIEPRDGLKIMADVRVKLNDKFNVNEETADRVVVVQKKYNAVCKYCQHELYIPTKQDLMEEYGLVEKK